jgi:hypothetical protein
VSTYTAPHPQHPATRPHRAPLPLTPPHHDDTATIMPRLPTALLRKAHAINPFLPPLLRTCRELISAQNELRWLREHVKTVEKMRQRRPDPAQGRMLRYKSMGIEEKKKIWRVVVRERARKRHRLDKVITARKTRGRTPAERQVTPIRRGRARSVRNIREQCAKEDSLRKAELLRSLIQKRAKGWPLQYGLGTEYFGDLELECRPGVLIPRSANA